MERRDLLRGSEAFELESKAVGTMADAVPAAMATALAATPATKPGGADRFLTFLTDELGWRCGSLGRSG